MYHWPGYLYFVGKKKYFLICPELCSLGWALCLTTWLGSMALVALYGLQFSKMKTYQWLTALVVNFFFTILIVEPCKVIVFTLFVAGRKKPIWDQDHLDADEEIPTIYYDVEDPENGKMEISLTLT